MTTHVTTIKPVVGMREGDNVIDKFTILSEQLLGGLLGEHNRGAREAGALVMKDDRGMMLLPPLTFKFITKRSTGKTRLRVVGHVGGILRGITQPEWDFATDPKTDMSKYKESRLDAYKRTVARALRAISAQHVPPSILESVSVRKPDGSFVFA